MKIFEKIKINLRDGRMRKIFLFGKEIVSYGKQDNNRSFFDVLPTPKKINKDTSFFYLKVNRDIEDSVVCVQHWINIVEEMQSDYVIICDNNKLKKRILSSVIFKDSNIKFIKSEKIPFRKIVKKQKLALSWYNAAFAHLTCFRHAEKNNIENFWNIDADDSLFLLPENKVADMLRLVMKHAENKKLDALGFDFWVTKTKGKHWSFGITYTRMKKNYFEILENKIIPWNDYRNVTSVHNLDWVFTYLKDQNYLKLSTFFVENMHFVHFGRFIGDMKNSYVASWTSTHMTWPIWENVFEDKRGRFEIPKSNDLINLDYKVSRDESLDFAISYLTKGKRVH